MRKLGLFMLLAMLAVGIHAQELTEKEIQAKEDSIFNLKISEDVHYAEVVVEMLTDDNEAVSLAQQQSMNLLQTYVVEIFAKRLNMSKQDVREIWDVIDDKCQNIEIRKGDLYKICKYIAKDAISGWLGGKKVKPLSPEDSIILFGRKEPRVLVPANVKPEPPVVVNPPAVKAGETVKPEQPVNPAPPVKPEPAVQPAKPEPPVKQAPTTDVVVPALCQKIMAKESFNPLMNFLSQEKEYGTLIFGSLSQMQYLSKCYVVVLDRATEKIAAVLDKGDSARMNFMTKKMDSHGNYDSKKYVLIFVQEY